jgi:UDP-glucose-4-epimerase GalE
LKIAVTGASGYIGSALTAFLSDRGHSVLGIDRSPPSDWAMSQVDDFAVADLCDGDLGETLKLFKPDALFHLAGRAIVSESVEQPEVYFRDNSAAMAGLLSSLGSIDHRMPVIFSSTCAVYGDAASTISEQTPTIPVNPYGESKLLAERILSSVSSVKGFPAIALRYFNVVGILRDGHQEIHAPETHLIPNLAKSVLERSKLQIYGSDFSTRDGTAERDYVHISDLIEGHWLALENALESQGGFEIFNLGSGSGKTVLEITRGAKEVFSDLEYELYPRRSGDPDTLVADIQKARRELGYSPKEIDVPELIREVTRAYPRS